MKSNSKEREGKCKVGDGDSRITAMNKAESETSPDYSRAGELRSNFKNIK